MQQKEDSVRKSEQSALNSHKWLKKLTMILTSVLLLTMFGLGGYWVGARQQQSSPPQLLTTPKPSWLPSATPVQQLSAGPTIVHSQADQTANWKTYRDPRGFFSIKYPSDPNITVQYMKESTPKGLLTNVVIQRSYKPGFQMEDGKGVLDPILCLFLSQRTRITLLLTSKGKLFSVVSVLIP